MHAADSPHVEKELETLAAQGFRIPPQPKVLLELRDAIVAGEFDVRVLGRILGQDPGLVAMLFKVARSPVFSRGRRLNKTEDVISLLGVKQTLSLVQALALSTAIGDARRKRAMETFWKRAGEVAQLAAMIAEDQVSVCNVFPEQAYLAGIFHECGVPVLIQRFPEYCKSLHLDSVNCWPSLSEEDRRFKVDHATIGYLIGRHWGLPDFVCASIRYHHELPTETLGAAVSLVAILQLAIHFQHRINNRPNPVWPGIGRRVEEELGLSADDSEDYYEDVAGRFLEASR